MAGKDLETDPRLEIDKNGPINMLQQINDAQQYNRYYQDEQNVQDWNLIIYSVFNYSVGIPAPLPLLFAHDW